MSCYQESANVSNQMGTDTQGCGLKYSGNYSVFNVGEGDVYITYVKPDGASNLSVWQVKTYQFGVANYSLPDTCWNQDNSSVSFNIQDLYYQSGGTFVSAISIYCAGVGWQPLTHNGLVLLATRYDNYGGVDNLNNSFYYNQSNADNFLDGNWDSYDFAVENQNTWLSGYPYYNVSVSDTYRRIVVYDEAMYWDVVPQWCLQNLPNESNDNCGSGSGSISYDSGHIYFNYSKPVGVDGYSLWQVKHGNFSTYNVSIPSSCWNYDSNSLALRMFSDHTFVISSDDIAQSNVQCYNGTGWQIIGSPVYCTGYIRNIQSGAVPSPAYDKNYSTYAVFQSTNNFWDNYYEIDLTGSLFQCSALYEQSMWWHTPKISAYFQPSTNVRAGDVIRGFCNSSNSYVYNWTLYKNNVVQSLGTTNIPSMFVNVVNVSGLVKGDSWTLSCLGGGSQVLSDAVIVQNTPHVLRFFRTNPLNVSLFNQFSVQANITDVDNDISFVNVTVLFPNGTITQLPLSLVNGLFVSQNFTAWNGLFRFNITSDDGLLTSVSLNIPDLLFVSPPDYVQISAGENFTFPITIDTNSTTNLSFSSTCSVDGIYFNCTLSENPIYVVGANVLDVTVITAGSTPNGSYVGNLTLTRDFDGRVIVIPVNLGIASSFGKPVLLNPSDFTLAVQTATTTVKTFVLYNNGSYPLSDCVGSFDNTLAGQGFLSFTSNFTLDGFSAMNYSAIFTNPQAGLYQGKMSIACVATPSGIMNSLEPTNRPSALVFAYPSYGGGGGGGGGGGTPQQIVVVRGGANESLFTVETDSGATVSVLYMYPKQTRQQIIIVRSQIFEDQQLTVKCVGDFCANVDISRSSFNIVGKTDELLFLNITMPDVPYGSVFTFDIEISDNAQHTGVLNYEVDVSRISTFLNKFAIDVKEGDAGFWFKAGSLNIPKDVLYLLEFLGSILIVYLSVPNPKNNKKYKDIKPLLYIIVSLGVVLVTLVVF